MPDKPEAMPAAKKSDNIQDKPEYEIPKAIDLGELEQGQGGLPVCALGSNPAGQCITGALLS